MFTPKEKEFLETVYKLNKDGKLVPEDELEEKPSKLKQDDFWQIFSGSKKDKKPPEGKPSKPGKDSGVGPSGDKTDKYEKKPYKAPEKWISAGGVVLAGPDDLDHVWIRKSKGAAYGGWCYDDQTEILTRAGWKLGLDLTSADEVAILVNGSLVFERPKSVQSFDYDGELLRFESRDLDLLVTPDHRMWVCRENKGDPAGRYADGRFEFIEAKDVPLSASFKRHARWTGTEREWFHLPEFKRTRRNKSAKSGVREDAFPECRVRMDDWLAFLGWFLSEGHASKPNGYSRGDFPGVPFVCISQKKPEGVKAIRSLLKRLPWDVYEHHSKRGLIDFRVKSPQLWAYLYDGKKAPEKRIPAFIKELSPRQIGLFLDAFWGGDGGTRPGSPSRWQAVNAPPSKIGRPRKQVLGDVSEPSRVFYSASKQLADGLAELILRTGMAPKVALRTWPEGSSHHGGAMYLVSELRPRPKMCASSVTRVQYAGKVWCPETSSGIVYVRRNGKSLWCGNTFAKGKVDDGETKEIAALREVEEEMGIVAEIIPGGYLGSYDGSYSVTHYYMMYAKRNLGKHDNETEKMMLASWTEAVHKFAKSGNTRDIKALNNAMDFVEKLKRKQSAGGR